MSKEKENGEESLILVSRSVSVPNRLPMGIQKSFSVRFWPVDHPSPLMVFTQS
ncbi:hypothetical protein SLEP1_g26453 [Rubroshorea leprosula]|uniref:Uncharacterized protein n=1 Tax=Rubroshorea leprosula TaxID=152421 RepID=A0AAV5JT64_9ROSI|nr:hypothetical protein SLEP1_g26453 [Rubroshorea leprosula]